MDACADGDQSDFVTSNPPMTRGIPVRHRVSSQPVPYSTSDIWSEVFALSESVVPALRRLEISGHIDVDTSSSTKRSETTAQNVGRVRPHSYPIDVMAQEVQATKRPHSIAVTTGLPNNKGSKI